MTLTLAHSRADLPPKWDGQPISWSEWRDAPLSSWDFHAPVDQRACTACGLIGGRRREATGRVGHAITLRVERCECGHDVVHDQRTHESWDLDLTDYGPEGSTADGSLW